MRRIFVNVALCLVALLIWYTAMYPQTVTGALSAALLQGRSWTFTALQSFSGVKFNATTQAVTPTGMKLDADTGSLDAYKDGILATRVKANEWTPPVCADANGPVNGGSLCYYNGRLLFRDGAGTHALVGEVP